MVVSSSVNEDNLYLLRFCFVLFFSPEVLMRSCIRAPSSLPPTLPVMIPTSLQGCSLAAEEFGHNVWEPCIHLPLAVTACPQDVLRTSLQRCSPGKAEHFSDPRSWATVGCTALGPECVLRLEALKASWPLLVFSPHLHPLEDPFSFT